MPPTSTVANAQARKRRRRNTLIISAVVALAIILLIRYEQISLLYVLSTFAVTALLVVVGWSSLGEAKRSPLTAPPLDDSAAISDGLATTLPDDRQARV